MQKRASGGHAIGTIGFASMPSTTRLERSMNQKATNMLSAKSSVMLSSEQEMDAVITAVTPDLAAHRDVFMGESDGGVQGMRNQVNYTVMVDDNDINLHKRRAQSGI